jgi:hypothetical protein
LFGRGGSIGFFEFGGRVLEVDAQEVDVGEEEGGDFVEEVFLPVLLDVLSGVLAGRGVVSIVRLRYEEEDDGICGLLSSCI